MSSTLLPDEIATPPKSLESKSREASTNGVDSTSPSEFVRPRRPSLLRACAMPIIAGLILRSLVALVWLQGTEPYNDGADYFLEATKLHAGTREAIPFYWPPGTSYYLAGWFTVLGSSITVARIAIVVMSTLQIAFAAGLAYQATKQQRIAVLSAWLWAVYPPSVLLVFQPYSQHLAALALAATAWSGIRCVQTRSLASLLCLGFSLGVGCLARPSMMSLVLLSLCGTFALAVITPGSWRKRLAAASVQSLILCLTAAAVVGPTILHNARTGGGYSLSTNNERNFFLGNNPHTPWYKTSHFAQRPLDQLSPEVQAYLLSHYEQLNRRSAMKAAALQHIMDRPDLAVLRTLNRARAFWGFDYLASRMIQATAHPNRLVLLLVLAAEAGSYCLVMASALVALAQFTAKINRTTLIWFLAVIIAYAAPYCLAFSSGSYHFPVMGLVVPFAAIGIDSLRRQGWRQAVRSVRVWSVLLLFVAMQAEYAYFTAMLVNSAY